MTIPFSHKIYYTCSGEGERLLETNAQGLQVQSETGVCGWYAFGRINETKSFETTPIPPKRDAWSKVQKTRGKSNALLYPRPGRLYKQAITMGGLNVMRRTWKTAHGVKRRHDYCCTTLPYLTDFSNKFRAYHGITTLLNDQSQMDIYVYICNNIVSFS